MIYHDQVGFFADIQGWFNILNKKKSNYAESDFDKLQHSLMIKTLKK